MNRDIPSPIWVITIILASILTLFGCIALNNHQFRTEPVPQISATSTETALDVWIDGLIEKESSHQDIISILDVNGKYSYGCLQFQKDTFFAYRDRYGLNWENDYIYSCKYQKRLAKMMIQENPGNWRHWYHSVYTRGLGYPPVALAK